MPDDHKGTGKLTSIISIDALVRSIGIRRDTKHLLFLGAGASITSGMPSAASCIWEWKRDLFLTHHQGLEKQFAELSLASVRRRLQDWLDTQQSFPKLNAPEEYGVYIEKCYPIVDDRRKYFENKVRDAKPFVGYQLLAELARKQIIGSVWSTNFDTLAAKAAAGANVPFREAGIDCKQRLDAADFTDFVCVSLHGDYRYDPLKNTAADLQQQEAEMRGSLIRHLQHSPAIVCGYSGRDKSIMEAFEAAYTSGGTAPLYWCDYSDSGPCDEVQNLLAKINEKGNRAYYIPGVGFDDLMRRLSSFIFKEDNNHPVHAILEANKVEAAQSTPAFSLPDLPFTGIIKSNAFPLQPPSEILQFDLEAWPSQKVWSTIAETADKGGFVAAPHRGKIFAFATPNQIQAAFGRNLKGAVERVPIDKNELRYTDSFLISLMRKALVRAMAASAGVPTNSHDLIWRAESPQRKYEVGKEYLVHEAMVLYIRNIGGKLFAVIKPTLYIIDKSGNVAPKAVERDLKIKILGYQHNKPFNDAVMEWRTRLLNHATQIFKFPAGNDPFNFEFKISRIPLSAAITDRREETINIPSEISRLITQRGLQLPEPELVFSNRSAKVNVKDTHPVRGLVANRPYDFSLTTTGLLPDVRMAVVSPTKDAKELHSWLSQLQQSANPGQGEADYLPPYPGFGQAFGLPLSMPSPTDPNWYSCPEPDSASSNSEASLQTARYITEAIASIHAASPRAVVLIYFPMRWQAYRGYETEAESFDLHDFVKAFAVQKNIPTQFLEGDTLRNPLQCRIRWWLSLALYVKNLRTPWALSSIKSDTAFVGLGFSQKRKNQNEEGHILLGCSHLYDAQGQGLQFRLNKIENPIYRAKNPYMSFDDARRVGENIRELFYEAHMALPKRVVIHKQTPFIDDERKGLEKGLDGIQNVELLEIFVDDALRYIASKAARDGGFEPHGYPIQRGTTVILDDRTALVWVHGASKALNPRQTYYQGKRRIPAPLVIRRHAGSSDLMTVVAEILGLSKMNWNSFDLYSQLPATIESSRQVAKIGALLERFSGTSYDYRLFM